MKAAFEFIEAALTLCAYAAFADYCTRRTRSTSRLWRGFTKRSAGPLWALLKSILEQMSDDAWLSKPLRGILMPDNAAMVDAAISALNDFKHDRLPAPVDMRPTVELLADFSYRGFKDLCFGYFERVQLVRFSREFEGVFRKASGVAPFFEIMSYRGSMPFSDHDPYLLQVSTGSVLPLSPFCFWDNCDDHPDLASGHLFVFDCDDRSAFSFKALGTACVRRVEKEGRYQALWSEMQTFRDEDPRIATTTAGRFDAR